MSNQRDPEDDLAREIQNHLDLEAEERVASGDTPKEARYAASRALGNRTLIKEDVRSVWNSHLFDTLVQDVRFAGRLLLKNPAFSAVAILTLALGIGANTAIFTVVNALMLKSLPYKNADRIVVPATVFERLNTDRGSVSYPDVQDWKAQKDIFEAVSMMNGGNFDVTGGNEPERIRGLNVDADYFRVFTDSPAVGRIFEDSEYQPETNRVVILSHNLWMRRYGGDASVLGKNVELGGVPHRIAGVMPPNTLWPEQAEIVKPMSFTAGQLRDVQRRDNHVFRVAARLKAGVALDQAQAKLTVLAARVAKEHTNRAQTSWKVHSLRNYILGPALSRTVWVLFGAVVLVLLIACVNVANLLLARGSARESEVAVRSALGAGRGRIAIQFMTESLMLATAGGVLGVMLGYAGAAALVRYAPEGVPRLDAVSVDGSVLAFTVGLTFLTVLLFGVAPALNLMRTAPASGVREGGRGSSGGRRSTRLRSILVMSELALALVLLASAGLLVRSFQSLQSVKAGFATHNVMTMQVGLPPARYAGTPQVVQAFDTMIEKLKNVPGVTSASAIGSLPLGGGGFYLGRVFLTTGQPEPPASRDTSALWSVIRPDTLQTLDIPVVAGRSFNASDTEKSNPVILISQFMAKQMFGDQNPLGRRIRSWRDENVYREIVGVVGDIRYEGLAENIGGVAYVPHTQSAWRGLVLLIRTQQDPAVLLRTIQQQIWSVDKQLALSEVRTMQEILDSALARPRFSMFLLGVFATTALLMAAIGIYGLMSFAVAQQTREIGIRMALGALRWDILKNVTGKALGLALGGVLVGIFGALAVTRLMTSLLFGVSSTDRVTFVAAAGLLICVALIAAYVPARRASRLDPLTALRYE